MNLDDMTEIELRELFQNLAVTIRNRLPTHTGFMLLAAPFGSHGVAQYVGNVERECAVKWMLETLLRWQRKDFVPRDRDEDVR